MATQIKIDEALKILNGYDWYWFIDDFGYTKYYESCKATMRRFVKTVSEVANPVVREALRNLWTLNYEYAKSRVDGMPMKGFEEKEKELLNVINS